MCWRTRINAWQTPDRFVDEQIRGPYRQWLHEHTFQPRDGGTLARDVVHYAVPFDFIAHPLLVRRAIGKIFAFRQEALRRRFGGDA
jgi:ligand-binding SRPBCC domain-containing protein